jgi:hypothetical protein
VEEISSLGGHVTIVLIMKKYPASRHVQTEGCAALLNLSYRKETIINAPVGKKRGVQVILDAMKTHPGDLELQTFGCGALANLTNSCEENTHSLVKHGGIPIVIDYLS